MFAQQTNSITWVNFKNFADSVLAFASTRLGLQFSSDNFKISLEIVQELILKQK
jgi:hypothetical protein